MLGAAEFYLKITASGGGRGMGRICLGPNVSCMVCWTAFQVLNRQP